MRAITVHTTGQRGFKQAIEVGPHRLVSDELPDLGGEDSGPSPMELLQSALGSCTSMTVKMYADRKGWPLRAVRVEVTLDRAPGLAVFSCRIALEGELDEAQRARCLEIAKKCPVHRILAGRIEIRTELATG